MFPIGSYDCRFPIRGSQFDYYEQPISDSRFMNVVFGISDGMKFWDLSGGVRHWRSESDYHTYIITVCFSILICEVCVENLWGGIGSIGAWEWVGDAESLMCGKLKSHLSFLLGQLKLHLFRINQFILYKIWLFLYCHVCGKQYRNNLSPRSFFEVK